MSAFAAAFAVFLVLPAMACAQTDWPVYGHDAGGMRYSPLAQIKPDNVWRLQLAWTYDAEAPIERRSTERYLYLTDSTSP